MSCRKCETICGDCEWSEICHVTESKNKKLICWINEEDKILSFHQEEGFVQNEFTDRDELRCFLLAVSGIYRIGKQEIHNSSDVNVTRVGERITDVTDKCEYVETKENEPVDKVGWIVRRISELGGYENVGVSVKADIFGFDIADVSGSIRLFSDVMKKLGTKLDGDEMYEEFQRIYDESVDRDTGKEKVEGTGKGLSGNR